MTSPAFLSPAWADAAAAAINAGPDDELRASKLPTYWEWIDDVRGRYTSTWALVDTDRPADLGGPAHLLVSWGDGRCTGATVVDGADAPGADYVLAAKHAVWADLLAGGDAGRQLMCRQIELRRGNVLQFFRGVYFVIEAVSAVARVPARMG